MGCYCDLVGDIEEPAAWGGLIRLERVRTRRIGISGELAVNVVESEFELIDAPGENPVHTRAGAGLVVRLVTIPVLDLQVTPRAGLFYGNYEHYSMMGPWGGVGFDALGWLTESLAFSVGVDGRVTVVSYMGGSGYYEGIEDHSGLRAEYELIVGFVFLL